MRAAHALTRLAWPNKGGFDNSLWGIYWFFFYKAKFHNRIRPPQWLSLLWPSACDFVTANTFQSGREKKANKMLNVKSSRIIAKELKMKEGLLRVNFATSNQIKQRFSTGVPRNSVKGAASSLLFTIRPIVASSGVAKYSYSWPKVPLGKRELRDTGLT